MNAYLCIVRNDGKCDSLTRDFDRAKYLLDIWSRCYPERGYRIEIRLYNNN